MYCNLLHVPLESQIGHVFSTKMVVQGVSCPDLKIWIFAKNKNNFTEKLLTLGCITSPLHGAEEATEVVWLLGVTIAWILFLGLCQTRHLHPYNPRGGMTFPLHSNPPRTNCDHDFWWRGLRDGSAMRVCKISGWGLKHQTKSKGNLWTDLGSSESCGDSARLFQDSTAKKNKHKTERIGFLH